MDGPKFIRSPPRRNCSTFSISKGFQRSHPEWSHSGRLRLEKTRFLSFSSCFGIFGIVDFRRHVLEDLLGRNLPQISKKSLKSSLGAPKSSPGASKIEPEAFLDVLLQRNFIQNQSGKLSPLGQAPILNQLGSKLEAQEAPKSRPKP